MQPNIGEFSVVEPGAFDPRVGDLETKRLDQVQDEAEIGGQANDRTGIPTDLRMHQDNMDHDVVPRYRIRVFIA